MKPSYSVLTVSLNDLLADHEAPETIDYLSIDTEGNEFEVLEGLDFKKYKFGAISVEVNGQEKKISHLLGRNGYVQVMSSFSKWDMWFVPNSSAKKFYRSEK